MGTHCQQDTVKRAVSLKAQAIDFMVISKSAADLFEVKAGEQSKLRVNRYLVLTARPYYLDLRKSPNGQFQNGLVNAEGSNRLKELKLLTSPTIIFLRAGNGTEFKRC
jgi:hypothetical protein